ncbi:MAG: tetratricopeptide repeat protein [Conexivisphaerales archaeon]
MDKNRISMERARESYSKGNFKDTIKLLKDFEKNRLDRYESLMLLGYSYFHLHKGKDAVRSFSEAISVSPGSKEAMLFLGKSYNMIGKRNDAVKAFRDALKIDPDYKDALINLGVTLAELANQDEADEIFRHVTEKFPEEKRGWYNLGLVNFHKKNYAESEASFKRALELEPEFTEALYNLAAVYCMTGNEELFTECVEKIKEKNSKLAKILISACKKEKRKLKW